LLRDALATPAGAIEGSAHLSLPLLIRWILGGSGSNGEARLRERTIAGLPRDRVASAAMIYIPS
jgi:hypothetical protein